MILSLVYFQIYKEARRQSIWGPADLCPSPCASALQLFFALVVTVKTQQVPA